MASPALQRISIIVEAISARWRLWGAIVLGFTVLFYLAQLAALVLKFGDLPNYWTFYNWPGSIWTILVSTPSLSDSLSIIAEEWLLEIGYMNYDFGNGISEWALSILPFRVAAVMALAAMLATVHVLLLYRRECGLKASPAAPGAAGVGGALVGFTSITMYWVVCCSSPTWVVGLAMMGLSASLSLWVEPVGPWLSAAGFALLALAIFIAASPGAAGSSTRVKGAGVVQENSFGWRGHHS